MIRSHERRGQAPLPDPAPPSGRLPAGTAECGQAGGGAAPLCGDLMAWYTKEEIEEACRILTIDYWRNRIICHKLALAFSR